MQDLNGIGKDKDGTGGGTTRNGNRCLRYKNRLLEILFDTLEEEYNMHYRKYENVSKNKSKPETLVLIDDFLRSLILSGTLSKNLFTHILSDIRYPPCWSERAFDRLYPSWNSPQFSNYPLYWILRIGTRFGPELKRFVLQKYFLPEIDTIDKIMGRYIETDTSTNNVNRNRVRKHSNSPTRSPRVRLPGQNQNVNNFRYNTLTVLPENADRTGGGGNLLMTAHYDRGRPEDNAIALKKRVNIILRMLDLLATDVSVPPHPEARANDHTADDLLISSLKRVRLDDLYVLSRQGTSMKALENIVFGNFEKLLLKNYRVPNTKIAVANIIIPLMLRLGRLEKFWLFGPGGGYDVPEKYIDVLALGLQILMGIQNQQLGQTLIELPQSEFTGSLTEVTAFTDEFTYFLETLVPSLKEWLSEPRTESDKLTEKTYRTHQLEKKRNLAVKILGELVKLAKRLNSNTDFSNFSPTQPIAATSLNTMLNTSIREIWEFFMVEHIDKVIIKGCMGLPTPEQPVLASCTPSDVVAANENLLTFLSKVLNV